MSEHVNNNSKHNNNQWTRVRQRERERDRGRERGRSEYVEWAQLTERLMQTKWQHLTPDECAANKSIYAKHLLIIIIRYAAHTRAYLQSTQPHTHTHTVNI